MLRQNSSSTIKAELKHTGIYVANIDRSIDFYERALSMHITRRLETKGRDVVFLGDLNNTFELELIYNPSKNGKYNLGDNTFHCGFRIENYDEAHELHEKMGCISRDKNISQYYWIKDPDGYEIEIIRASEYMIQ